MIAYTRQDWAKIRPEGSSQDPSLLSAGNGVGDTVLGGTQRDSL